MGAMLALRALNALGRMRVGRSPRSSHAVATRRRLWLLRALSATRAPRAGWACYPVPAIRAFRTVPTRRALWATQLGPVLGDVFADNGLQLGDVPLNLAGVERCP